MKFHETFGPYAFIIYSIAVSLRDLGMTMAPQNAFQTLLGLETLSLRMKKHVSNSIKIANWLEKHPKIEKVTYAGLKSSKYFNTAKSILPKGAGALFTISLKDGYEACMKMINKLNLFSHVSNLGDTRSPILEAIKKYPNRIALAAGAFLSIQVTFYIFLQSVFFQFLIDFVLWLDFRYFFVIQDLLNLNFLIPLMQYLIFFLFRL